MRKSWSKTCTYEPTKAERKFQELLRSNGYIILGFKEFVSKTFFLIEKDGIQCEYAIHVYNNCSGEKQFSAFENYYAIKKEYEMTKKEFLLTFS